MKKWIVTGLVVLVLVALGVTVRRWLPVVLPVLDAQSSRIQGTANAVQLFLWGIAGVLLIGRLWRDRKPQEAEGRDGPRPERPQSRVTGPGSSALGDGAVSAGQGGTAVGGDLEGGVTIVNVNGLQIRSPEDFWQAVGERRPPEDLTRATERYLSHLVELYRYLPFKGMGVTDRVALRLPLLDLYIPLKARVEAPEGETWTRQVRLAGRAPAEDEVRAMGERLSEPRPLLDLLRSADGLIVLGDPGAGKSTFLKFLALSLASGQGNALGLERYLPVLLPVSAYADALAKEDVPLIPFIAHYYQKLGVELPVEAMLRRALEKGGALVLFDGLDEVQDLQQRLLVVERVREFYSFHRKARNKFVLTSRIVGYREVRPEAEGLAECTLVDFEDEEIQEFVEKWTLAVERAVGGETQTSATAADRERRDLLDAVQSNPGVRSLAANPLLLTILALMKRQGVSLPERRVQLYQTYVETLLRSWNLARSLSARSGPALDVVETLKILPPLALWMHETSPGIGLVKEGDLGRRLEEIFAGRGEADPENAARRFLADVRHHAALLLDRGGRQYGFIHLTFQEYLAAVALARRWQQGIDPEALISRVGDPAWHEVLLLVVGYLGIVLQLEDVAGALVEEILRRGPGVPGEAAVLAGRAVVDSGPGGVTPACRAGVTTELLEIMRNRPGVAAVQRVEAGRVLADLGDPRAGVLTLDAMELCWIPPGPFRMGSGEQDSDAWEEEKPLHTCDIPYGYWIGRYPVTVAQFRQYVEASGVQPGDPDSLRGAANEPVVWVSWAEAMGFCSWLAGFWRTRGLMGKTEEVRLPSEAEWEKAARGGLEVPVNPAMAVVSQRFPGAGALRNEGTERRFPWGDDPDPEKANYSDTELGRPSTVGCFPGGASPYGCEEMSGNAWEWTRSLWGENSGRPAFVYPYQPDDGREELSASAKGLRVLRGGSCLHVSRDARCACRFRLDPTYRLRDVGFRVVLSPFFSDL